MKSKVVPIIWGLVLILGGGLLLAQTLGYLSGFSTLFWVVVLAGLSVLFFVTYFLNGVQHWGWLFPAFIFGGTALTVGLAEVGVADSVVAAPVLLAVAIPFLVAFVLDMRQNWWALIPAWVMIVVTAIVFFADRIQGEFIATLVLWSIALPFLVVFLLNRARTWALIPFLVLAVVGLIPPLSTGVSGDLMGAVVELLIAVSFLIVFLWSRKNWWALIPAGIMGGIGLGLLFEQIFSNVVQNDNVMSGVMFLGWAVAFGVLWLLRKSYPTAWARFPAIVLAVIAVFLLASGSSSQLIWPILIVVAGVVLLVVNLLPKRAQ